MSDSDSDELALLRSELRRMGVPGSSSPEDFGLAFQPAEAFFETGPHVAANRFRRRTWIPTAMVAVAASILAIAVIAPGGRVDDEPSPPDATVSPEVVTVAQVLRQAATASAGLPDETKARFWRVDSIQKQGDAPAEKRTVWLGRTEPGLVIDDFGRAELPPAVFGLVRTKLSWEDLITLPTDPVVLRDLFEQEAKGLPNPNMLVANLAASLLAESPAPPQVREALWRVIAGVSGVVSRGNVKDALGRPGIGLALGTANSGFAEYVIDPEHGRILEATTRSSRPGADLFRVTYLDQGPADQIPAE